MAVSPNKEEVYITANVTEGQKFTVSEVGLSGDLVLPEEDLSRFLIVQPEQSVLPAAGHGDRRLPDTALGQ